MTGEIKLNVLRTNHCTILILEQHNQKQIAQLCQRDRATRYVSRQHFYTIK